MHKDEVTTSSRNDGNTVLPEVFVGQILYREKSYRNEPTKIEEVIVGKTGKKYFYLTGWEERYPIDKETLRYTDKVYSQNGFQLYRDKQQILDKNETANLYTNIQKVFRDYSNNNRLTLEQLRNISDILGCR